MGLNKKDKTPLISVIVPVFNCEKYVDQAIKSILDQTTEDFELIISDDGSTDGSRSILDDYARKDMRIQLSHNEFNQGKTVSME